MLRVAKRRTLTARLPDIYISDNSFNTIVKASLPDRVSSNLTLNFNQQNEAFHNILFQSQENGGYRPFKQGGFQTVSYVSTLLHSGHDVQSNQETITPVFQELKLLQKQRQRQGLTVFPAKILCGLHFPGHYNASEIEIEQNVQGKFILKIGRYEPFRGYLPISEKEEPAKSIIASFQAVFGTNLEIQQKPQSKRKVQDDSVCCGPISAEFISNLIKTGDAFLGINKYAGSRKKNMALRQAQDQRIQEAVGQEKITPQQASTFINDHQRHHFTKKDSDIIQQQFQEFKLLQEIGDTFIGADYVARLNLAAVQGDAFQNFLQKFMEKEQNARSWVDYFFGFEVYAPNSMAEMATLRQRHEYGIVQKVLQRFYSCYFSDPAAVQDQMVASANSPQNQILSLNHLVKFAYFLHKNGKINDAEFKEILSKKTKIFDQDISVIDYINQVFQDNLAGCQVQIGILKNTISKINQEINLVQNGLNQGFLIAGAVPIDLSEFGLLQGYLTVGAPGLTEEQALQRALAKSLREEQQRMAKPRAAIASATLTAAPKEDGASLLNKVLTYFGAELEEDNIFDQKQSRKVQENQAQNLVPNCTISFSGLDYLQNVNNIKIQLSFTGGDRKEKSQALQEFLTAQNITHDDPLKGKGENSEQIHINYKSLIQSAFFKSERSKNGLKQLHDFCEDLATKTEVAKQFQDDIFHIATNLDAFIDKYIDQKTIDAIRKRFDLTYDQENGVYGFKKYDGYEYQELTKEEKAQIPKHIRVRIPNSPFWISIDPITAEFVIATDETKMFLGDLTQIYNEKILQVLRKDARFADVLHEDKRTFNAPEDESYYVGQRIYFTQNAFNALKQKAIELKPTSKPEPAGQKAPLPPQNLVPKPAPISPTVPKPKPLPLQRPPTFKPKSAKGLKSLFKEIVFSKRTQVQSESQIQTQAQVQQKSNFPSKFKYLDKEEKHGEKTYKFYATTKPEIDTQNQHRFDFSSTKDLTKQLEVSNFKTELYGIFEKSYQEAGIDYQDAIKFALIAVKNGGIYSFKEKFKEEYKKLQPEISDDQLTQKLKQAIKFSALFQRNCDEKDLKTGNQDYTDFVGMRLKRLDPKLLYEIHKETLNEENIKPIKKVIKEVAEKIEVQDLVPRSIVKRIAFYDPVKASPTTVEV